MAVPQPIDPVARQRPENSQERIFSLLGEGERRLLTLLIAAHPESLQRVELTKQGYNAESGGFGVPWRG